jgi:transaldolase
MLSTKRWHGDGDRAAIATRVAAATAERFAVSVGVELLRLVPGYVSTEVDGNLSFNVAAPVARAHQINDAYKQRGVGSERVLIKLAKMWEGASAERPIALPRTNREA